MRSARLKTLFGLLLAVLLFFACWPSVAAFIIQKKLSEARAAGSRIAWQGVSASYLSARTDLLEIWIPGPPLSLPVAGVRLPVPGPAIKFEFRNLALSVDLTSLLRFSPVVRLTAQVYGGILEAQARTLFSDTIEGELKLVGTTLDKHPQLRALGIGGGGLEIKASALSYSPIDQELVSGRVDLSLTRLSLPSRPELSTFLKIDALRIDSFTAQAEASRSSVTLSPVDFKSSLGGFTGRASVRLPGKRSSFTLDSSADVTLTGPDAASLGQWLPLVSGGQLQPDDRSFTLKANSALCSDRTPIELPFGCIRVDVLR
jgi:hypothetical protein